MTQWNSLNVKLPNSQPNKLKPASNLIGDDETNFPCKLLLTNRQVLNLRKIYADKSSTDIKFSKTQISKMIQSGGFLGRLLGPLLKTGLPLIKKVIKPLAKSVLIPLRLTAPASAADAEIHKKILGSVHRPSSSSALPYHPSSSASHNNNTILIISNDEMKNIIKIVNFLENSSLLPKGVSQSIQNEAKEPRGRFLSMSLGSLGGSLLGNILAGKGINRAEKEIVKAGYGNKKSQKRQYHKNKMEF